MILLVSCGQSNRSSTEKNTNLQLDTLENLSLDTLQVYRFCGEREINPDMSSEILKDVPHYYGFG